MTPQEFATKIRQKYPGEYDNVPDVELARKVVDKFPVYANQVTFEQKPQRSALEKTSDVLDTVFGGKKIGEAIGTVIAKAQATPEERKFIEGPKASEVVGDIVRTGLTFAPIGKIAGVATKALGKVGLTKGAGIAGDVIAGGTIGAGADIAINASEGETPELGLGTILGAGIPATAPIVKALGRASAKLIGRGASEIEGALTGTSAETMEQAFNAARTGGKELEQFTSALRGKTTPEALVNATRENISKISTQRQQLFRQTLDELGDTVVDTSPAKSSFIENLSKAGIQIGDKNILNFNSSKLKLVPSAQTKIQTAWQEVSNLPDQVALGNLDTTRQAIKALTLAGDDPSANLANKLLDDAVRGVRKAGESVEGYGQMLDNFGETSQFLDELERGLSVGDRKTIDDAYRRMATALKTNNEQRKALVKELDDATDGAILSTIAGQQLSEALPRGIFRQIAAGLGGISIVTGGLSPQLIPALVFASPRVAGEFVRALGIGANKASKVLEAISTARNTLIKIGAIGGSIIENSSDLEDKVEDE